MATEEKKKENRLRLTNMALLSLASGTWDTLGESVFAFSGPMGDRILHIMEQEMGLEIGGETPADVLMEISRIFVDEFGFAGDIEVVIVSDDEFQLKVHTCVNRKFTDMLMDAGVEKPFVCPVLNACQAALRRMGYKMHEKVEKWSEGKGSIITFTSI